MQKPSKCMYCGLHPVDEKHHLWPGRGRRHICEKYNLIAYMGKMCHDQATYNYAFRRNVQERMCKRYGINFEKINQLMHRSARYWSAEDREYMEFAADQVKQYFIDMGE